MNCLYLSNCPLCNKPLVALQASPDQRVHDRRIQEDVIFFCIGSHFSYDVTRGIIITKHDYGEYNFYLIDKNIRIIIFNEGDYSQRIWQSEVPDLFNILGLENPTINDIPSIIERYEIRKTFK